MKLRSIIAAVSAAVMLAGCGAGESSSAPESRSEPTTSVSAPESVSESISESVSESTPESAADSSLPEQQPSDITPLMWEVGSENGGHLYLLGSMHALKDECYPLPEKITAALESADTLAVECDITESAASLSAQLAQVKYMYYSEGTVADHLSPEVLEGVTGFVEACGMSTALYRTAKPWVYLELAEAAAFSQTDLDLSLGLDLSLIKSAKTQQKEITELESPESQLETISQLPEEVCEFLLSAYTAETKDDTVKALNDTYIAWRDGDYDFFARENSLSAVEDLLAGLDPETAGTYSQYWQEYNERMLFSRNRAMTEKLEQMLSDGRNVLVTIGISHFCGEGGIIELLKADGYQPEQVK